MKAPGSSLRRRMTSGMSGDYENALPDSYGLTVEDLKALMEEWRTAAAQR